MLGELAIENHYIYNLHDSSDYGKKIKNITGAFRY